MGLKLTTMKNSNPNPKESTEEPSLQDHSIEQKQKKQKLQVDMAEEMIISSQVDMGITGDDHDYFEDIDTMSLVVPNSSSSLMSEIDSSVVAASYVHEELSLPNSKLRSEIDSSVAVSCVSEEARLYLDRGYRTNPRLWPEAEQAIYNEILMDSLKHEKTSRSFWIKWRIIYPPELVNRIKEVMKNDRRKPRRQKAASVQTVLTKDAHEESSLPNSNVMSEMDSSVFAVSCVSEELKLYLDKAYRTNPRLWPTEEQAIYNEILMEALKHEEISTSFWIKWSDKYPPEILKRIEVVLKNDRRKQRCQKAASVQTVLTKDAHEESSLPNSNVMSEMDSSVFAVSCVSEKLKLYLDKAYRTNPRLWPTEEQAIYNEILMEALKHEEISTSFWIKWSDKYPSELLKRIEVVLMNDERKPHGLEDHHVFERSSYEVGSTVFI